MPIRKANLQDLDELLRLMQLFYEHFQYHFEADKHRQIVIDFLTHDYFGSLWLVLNNGQSVGYIALTHGFTFEFGGKDAFIDEFFIEEKYRNSGIGKLALQAIQQKSSQLGINALHLHTEKYNQRAKKLYESLQFVDLERSTLTWINTNKHQ